MFRQSGDTTSRSVGGRVTGQNQRSREVWVGSETDVQGQGIQQVRREVGSSVTVALTQGKQPLDLRVALGNSSFRADRDKRSRRDSPETGRDHRLPR